MQYLVGQMLTCLLGAALFGLLIGFIWWGMQLRKARERAADFEQRAAKLSGYPARLTDLEATHAAFVASKNEESAKCKSRIGELEPLAAKAPVLEKSLAALQTKFDELAAQHTARMGELKGVIAEHERAHADKDVRLASLGARVAELEPVAQKVPLLEAQIAQHLDAHRETEEHLDQLAAQVKQQDAAHTEKDARIAELVPLAALVPGLKAELEAKDKHAAGLSAQVEQHIATLVDQDSKMADLASQVQQHEEAHAAKDARIAELAPLAALVPELKTQVEQHVAAHAGKDAKIAELAPLAALVPELKTQVERHASALAEKDAHIAALTSQLEEQSVLPAARAHDEDEHVAELVAAAALVPVLKSELESKEYEHNLTARKLRMAESATAAHQAEIAKLQDQILMHKAELESAAQLKAPVVAMATGAAAMEFYDVNEGRAADVTPPLPPDHVREFERRIEELRNAESAKDAEITKLRDQLAALEAAPDPDTRRQILSAAKDAEIANMRAVLNTLFLPISPDDIAARAYGYAKDRGFLGGSPTEDWLRAERDAHHSRLAAAWQSTRGGGTMF
jgi:chromosome segregation ATPase